MRILVPSRWCDPVVRAARCRAVWVFAVAWVAAAGVTAWHESVRAAGVAVGALAGWMMFAWLTVLLTEAPPRHVEGSRRRLLAQAAIPLAVIAATAVGLGYDLPIWQPSLDWLVRRGVPFPARYPTILADPVLYVLIPLPLLVLAGSRPAELGLSRGTRTVRMTLLWCAVPVIVIGSGVVVGARRWSDVGHRLLGNLYQNGPVEEFLWRGALQPRAMALHRPATGLIGTALGFGFWHVRADLADHHDDVLSALCACVTVQAVAGLGLGVLAWRTRSILTGSVLHTLMDALGG